jgi:hypothetical protein
MEVEKPVNKLLSSDGKTSGWMGGIPLCKLGTNSRSAKTAHNTTQVIPNLATGFKGKKNQIRLFITGTYKKSTGPQHPLLLLLSKQKTFLINSDREPHPARRIQK